MLSHRLTHSRISAFIALLAIGLLFIAPDISKILEQQRMSAFGGMRMGMHEMTMPQAINKATNEIPAAIATQQTGENGLASGPGDIVDDRSRTDIDHSTTPDNTATTEHQASRHRDHSATQRPHRAASESPHAPPVARAHPHATLTSSAPAIPHRSAAAHGDQGEASTMESMPTVDHMSAMGIMPGMDPVNATGSMDEFSCGYCELLVHLPMLVWIFIPLLWLILLTSRLPPSLTLPAYPLCWFPGTSQPRAPPVA